MNVPDHAESDKSEGDDDDNPPSPPGSGSNLCRPKLVLGSIVMGIWKIMRWATPRNDKRGLEDRSFGATIGMEKYENEWGVFTGNYRLPRRRFFFCIAA